MECWEMMLGGWHPTCSYERNDTFSSVCKIWPGKISFSSRKNILILQTLLGLFWLRLQAMILQLHNKGPSCKVLIPESVQPIIYLESESLLERQTVKEIINISLWVTIWIRGSGHSVPYMERGDNFSCNIADGPLRWPRVAGPCQIRDVKQGWMGDH